MSSCQWVCIVAACMKPWQGLPRSSSAAAARRSPDPTDEQVEKLLGVKLTGGREQLILAISQIDEAVGEKAKKERVAVPKLKKITCVSLAGGSFRTSPWACPLIRQI